MVIGSSERLERLAPLTPYPQRRLAHSAAVAFIDVYLLDSTSKFSSPSVSISLPPYLFMLSIYYHIEGYMRHQAAPQLLGLQLGGQR